MVHKTRLYTIVQFNNNLLIHFEEGVCINDCLISVILLEPQILTICSYIHKQICKRFCIFCNLDKI